MDSSDIGACQPATHDIIFLDGLYTIILIIEPTGCCEILPFSRLQIMSNACLVL